MVPISSHPHAHPRAHTHDPTLRARPMTIMSWLSHRAGDGLLLTAWPSDPWPWPPGWSSEIARSSVLFATERWH